MFKQMTERPTKKSDIERLLGRPINMVSYKDFEKINSLEDCLGPNGEFLLHLPSSSKYGHWICVFINKDGDIEVFNSYGNEIDSDLDMKSMSVYFDEINLELYPHLTKLLLDTGSNIEYNNHKLQGWGSATCGNWCGYRLLRKDQDIDEFAKYFTKKKENNDEILMALVYLLLKKN